MLGAAHHKSKREVVQLVASLRPLPPVASVVRKLPAPPVVTRDPQKVSRDGPQAPGANAPPTARTIPELLFRQDGDASTLDVSAGARNATVDLSAEARSAKVEERRRVIIRPLAAETYKVQFTMPREMHERLREAQNL